MDLRTTPGSIHRPPSDRAILAKPASIAPWIEELRRVWKVPAPSVGARIVRPRMLGGDGQTRGTVKAVDDGYITVEWADGRTNVMPAQIVAAPGWRIDA